MRRKKKRIEKQQRLKNNWIICYIYFFYSDTDSIELIRVFIICHLRVLIKIISIWLKFSSKKKFVFSLPLLLLLLLFCLWRILFVQRIKREKREKEQKARGLRQHKQSQPSDYVFLVEETKYINSCSCLSKFFISFFFTNSIQ